APLGGGRAAEACRPAGGAHRAAGDVRLAAGASMPAAAELTPPAPCPSSGLTAPPCGPLTQVPTLSSAPAPSTVSSCRSSAEAPSTPSPCPQQESERRLGAPARAGRHEPSSRGSSPAEL